MNAFVCLSAVQIMRAFHMRLHYKEFNNESNIYISYKCPGGSELAKNIKKTGVFSNVFFCDTSDIKRHAFFYIMFGKSPCSRAVKNYKYEKLIAFNIEDELTQALFNLNKNNAGFEYHCVEDGPNVYSIYVPSKYKWYHPAKILGLDKQAYHMKCWWTSCPEFIELPKEFHTEKKRLTAIDIHDNAYRDLINIVFNYKNDEELDQADLLIMDESHYQDGLMVDNADLAIYLKIKEKFPNLNIMVKMHPRTKNNRYKGAFNILNNTDIPWELYVLNRYGDNKKSLIQISIVCGTMVSDYFMFGAEGKKIVMAPMFYEKVRIPQNGTPRVSLKDTERYTQIRNLYKTKNNFVIANDFNEVCDAINNMMS